MAIPKIIYQTFRNAKLPFITKWHIKSFRKKNPGYQYEFYDDEKIEKFLEEEFGNETLKAYQKIQIGAAKADFFRYAVLLKKGGIYLDIDSSIVRKLDDFILPGDVAVIAPEGNPGLYVQWALVYEAHHPFLQRTMELVLENIAANKFPHDVHSMTGPGVYSRAIKECLSADPFIPYRLMGVDYEGCLAFKYPLNKLLYKKGEHWKKAQKTKTVLR
ncbi:MAG TPA: glycosyltransferase [Flavisolibacter sp.]|nr:glycosyltransferase [Flavisolibacter sp.]